jgi:hypothetical protein
VERAKVRETNYNLEEIQKKHLFYKILAAQLVQTRNISLKFRSLLYNDFFVISVRLGITDLDCILKY